MKVSITFFARTRWRRANLYSSRHSDLSENESA